MSLTATSGVRPRTCPPGSGAAGADGVAEDPDAFDLELDHVAGLEPAAVAVLQDAPRPDGARPEHVARVEPRVARGLLDELRPREVHLGHIAARPLLAVHPRDHRARRPVEFVDGDDRGTDARSEVLALCRPQPDAHLS